MKILHVNFAKTKNSIWQVPLVSGILTNLIFFLYILLKVVKVRRPVRKTSGFRTVRILKICRTSRLDVMSGRALLEITIFGLKIMVKSGLEFFYFEILGAPSELLLPSAKRSAEKG